MFILSQFTNNEFRFVELNLHKLVSLLWQPIWMWQETGVWKEYIYKKKKLYIYIIWGGAPIGISPRASNWLETALSVWKAIEMHRPKGVGTPLIEKTMTFM